MAAVFGYRCPVAVVRHVDDVDAVLIQTLQGIGYRQWVAVGEGREQVRSAGDAAPRVVEASSYSAAVPIGKAYVPLPLMLLRRLPTT